MCGVSYVYEHSLMKTVYPCERWRAGSVPSALLRSITPCQPCLIVLASPIHGCSLMRMPSQKLGFGTAITIALGSCVIMIMRLRPAVLASLSTNPVVLPFVQLFFLQNSVMVWSAIKSAKNLCGAYCTAEIACPLL